MTTSETPELPAAPAPVAVAAAVEALSAVAPADLAADLADFQRETAPAQPEPTPPAEPEAPAAPTWPHQFLDFKGEHLEIRAPKSSAVVALQLMLSGQFDQAQQNEAVGLFLRLHLSPASMVRVTERMIDPDETEFGENYLPLIVAMIERSDELAKEQADADAAPAAP